MNATQLVQEILKQDGLLGTATFWIVSGLLWAWTHLLHKVDLDNDWKRALSVGVAVVVVLGAYFYADYKHLLPPGQDVVFALSLVPGALGVSKVWFTGLKVIENVKNGNPGGTK